MKTNKSLILYLILSISLLFSCSHNNENMPVKLTKSIIGINKAGEANTIELNSTEDWTIEVPESASWLTVNPKAGKAGKTNVTFSATVFADPGTRSASLKLTSKSGFKQILVVNQQGLDKLVILSNKEALEKEVGSKVAVKGVVTSFISTVYGNYYLEDEEGKSLFVYGTLDANGNSKNFASLGIDVGDVITVVGTVGEYKNKKQLVNVSVINIKKSLIKADEQSLAIKSTETEYTFTGTIKSDNINVVPSTEGLSTKSISIKNGMFTIVFNIAQNTEDLFKAYKFTISTSNNGQVESNEYRFTQGAVEPTTIEDVTIAEVLTKNKSNTNFYRLTGTITEIKNSSFGQLTISDGENSIFVYGLNSVFTGTKKKSDLNYSSLKLKEGDKITIVGTKDEYKKSPQITNAYFISKEK